MAAAELWVDGSLQTPVKTNAPFDFAVTNPTLGDHAVAVIGQDTSGNRAANSVGVMLLAPAQPRITLVSTVVVTQLYWSVPGFLLQSAGIITACVGLNLEPALRKNHND